MEKAKVDAAGRGRVFSGSAARELGLVDALGGLREAVDAAKERAGLEADADVEVEVVGAGEGLLDMSFASAEDSSWVARVVKAAGLERSFATFELGDAPLALVPYEVKVR